MRLFKELYSITIGVNIMHIVMHSIDIDLFAPLSAGLVANDNAFVKHSSYKKVTYEN